MGDRSKVREEPKETLSRWGVGPVISRGEHGGLKLEGQSSMAYSNSHIGHLLLGGHVMAFLKLPQKPPENPGCAGQLHLQSSPKLSQIPRNPGVRGFIRRMDYPRPTVTTTLLVCLESSLQEVFLFNSGWQKLTTICSHNSNSQGFIDSSSHYLNMDFRTTHRLVLTYVFSLTTSL